MHFNDSMMFILVLLGFAAVVLLAYKIIFYLLQRRERQQVMEKLNAEQTLEYLAVDRSSNKDAKISIPPAWVLRLGLVGVLVASVLIYTYSQAQNGKPMDDAFAIVLSIAAAAVGFVVSFFIEYWLANRHKSEFNNAAPINKYTMLRWTLAVVGVGFGIANNAYQNGFLPVLGGMVLWGAIGLAIGLWVEHYFTKGKSDNRNINMTSLLVKVAFTLLGVGIGVIGGALWLSTLPDDFHYGEIIASCVVLIFGIIGFFTGLYVDKKINRKKE